MQTEPQTIQDGVIVLFEYTLSDADGNVIESSVGEDPLPYLQGHRNIVPGLERQMTGHKAGDAFKAVVPAAEAYGEHDGSDPESVPRSELPDGIDVGMPILAELPDGSDIQLWVHAMDEENVMLSQNHPLAGVPLTFDVAIKSLRAATEEELAHGHPHGADGTESHHHEHDEEDEE